MSRFEFHLVTDPVKHRVNDRQARVDYYKIHGKDNVIFDAVIDGSLGDTDWVCDFCNETLNASEPIMCDESNAWCKKCLAVELSKSIRKGASGEQQALIAICECCVNNIAMDKDGQEKVFSSYFLSVGEAIGQKVGMELEEVSINDDGRIINNDGNEIHLNHLKRNEDG